MSLAVAITTAPRPRPTLAESFASFRRAGFRERVAVLSDGPVDASLPGSDVIENMPPLGGLRNWCAALDHLVTHTGADWLMVLEDDILWCEGAAAALTRDLREFEARRMQRRIGYLSLYLPHRVSKVMERGQYLRRRLPRGWHASTLGGACWSSLAYALPRNAAVALLRDPEFQDARAHYAPNRNRDRIVSGSLARLGRQLLDRVPCLVNHDLGNENSSLANKPLQLGAQTRYWTGKP